MGRIFDALVQDSIIRRQQEAQRRQLEQGLSIFGPQPMQAPAPIAAAGLGGAAQAVDPLAQLQTKNPLETIMSKGLLSQEEIPQAAALLQSSPNAFGMLLKSRMPELGQSGSLPAAIQEYIYFNNLPSDQAKKDFLSVKRGSTVSNIGGVPTLLTGNFQDRLSSLEAEMRAKSGIAQAGATGAGTGKRINNIYDSIPKMRSGIETFNQALAQLDRGANVGVIYDKLPSFTDASITLDNIRNQLGLQVVGSATFGPLSEAELKFAMQTAMPQNMSAEELRGWITRKRDAQNKVMQAMIEEAQWLESGKPRVEWANQFKDKQRKGVYNPQTGKIEWQ